MKSPTRPRGARTARKVSVDVPSRGGSRAAEAPRSARTRRTPDEAKAIILEAAQDLLARDGPDRVGLKDVAARAGVSHALVTHYFGTIDALIDASLAGYAERQRAVLIEHIARHSEDGPREWMKLYFDWISQPATARMFAWVLVTGRISSDDFFSGRQRGARRIADAIEARFAAEGQQPIDRADLEFIMLLLLSAPHGYGIGKKAFWASLGRDHPGAEEDTFFFDRLAGVVERFLGRDAGSSADKRPRGKRGRSKA